MNYEKTLKQQQDTLNEIITLLKQNKQDNTFKNKIHLYGTINYTRTQYLPQLSKQITEEKKYEDIFFNYTSAESMILDILSVIESDLIKNLDEKDNYDTTKATKLITFTNKLLEILENILKTKDEEEKIDKKDYQTTMEQNTQKLFNLQNQFYTLIYDEKIDFRVK